LGTIKSILKMKLPETQQDEANLGEENVPKNSSTTLPGKMLKLVEKPKKNRWRVPNRVGTKNN